jgi:hypothetical protein
VGVRCWTWEGVAVASREEVLGATALVAARAAKALPASSASPIWRTASSVSSCCCLWTDVEMS